MATNLLSKLLPPRTGEPSFYETLRQYDELEPSETEESPGMVANEERLGTRYRNRNEATDDPAIKTKPANITTRSAAGKFRDVPVDGPSTQKGKGTAADEFDDEVPRSLLIEEQHEPISNEAERRRMQSPPVLGSTNRGVRAKWQATRQQQRLYQDELPPPVASGRSGRGGRGTVMDPKERALWMWANVENLDNFLAEIYEYYTGNGIWSITLARMLNLLSVSHMHTSK